MSADNQIAVLNLKDQSRVVHIGSPNSLYWSGAVWDYVREIVPTRIVENFIESVPMPRSEAMSEAVELDETVGYVEYGIGIYNVDATWLEIVREARKLIIEERNSAKLLSENKSVILKDINELDNIIEKEYQKLIGG